jgi:hypothetical protein
MARTSHGVIGSEDDAAPSRLPEVTPPPPYGRDHSFTLQTILELQRSFGRLEEKVDRLAEDSRTQIDGLSKLGDKLGIRLDTLNEKVDRLRMWVARVVGGATVLGFLVWLVTMWRDAIGHWLLSH